MTHPARRSLALTMLVTAFLASGCGSATPSAAPSASVPPSPPPSATASSMPAPTATPAPSATPLATPVASTACQVTPQTGKLPSDRLTGVKVTAGANSDSLTFHFGNPSLGPAGPPEGSLETAVPPYTQAASGATIAVDGDHVLQVRFERMSLSNDAGQETYTGPTEFKPDLPALRQAVMYDATEGVIGWYVGYDGGGCVTLATTGFDVTLTIAHS